ncbi:UvrD-helicase domain-containing protein, partial [bacterium]|nr:UvrD-helicase domain-containing protein [bacterium]
MSDTTYLDNLNERQKEAVLADLGEYLVLAGAGSGKTKVLTSRIANLVQKGNNPNEILAVTFTNKAAREMQERLSVYLGENIVKGMWVGTFHSICGRILRRDLANYRTKDGKSWNNNYVIYDDSDSKTVIKNILKKMNLDEKVYEIKTIRAAISNAKNKMQDAIHFATYAKDYYTQKVSEIYLEYEKNLALNNALDFDDMLMLAVNLLKENEDVRQKYSSRFKHILVDEFQDTNRAQYDLISMLFPKEKKGSLCVVGDVDQSIYSWRGADFRIILNFQK